MWQAMELNLQITTELLLKTHRSFFLIVKKPGVKFSVYLCTQASWQPLQSRVHLCLLDLKTPIMAGQPGAPTPKMQLVDGEAQFNTTELQSFVANAKLVERKTEYQVVAIMGPQSSGKSTLLNHVVSLSTTLGSCPDCMLCHAPSASSCAYNGAAACYTLLLASAVTCLAAPIWLEPSGLSHSLPCANLHDAVWHLVRHDGCHDWAQPDHKGVHMAFNTDVLAFFQFMHVVGSGMPRNAARRCCRCVPMCQSPHVSSVHLACPL